MLKARHQANIRPLSVKQFWSTTVHKDNPLQKLLHTQLLNPSPRALQDMSGIAHSPAQQQPGQTHASGI